MQRLQQHQRDASGFRLRAARVTRLETFVDAAFAFSLTLPVIVTSDCRRPRPNLVPRWPRCRPSSPTLGLWMPWYHARRERERMALLARMPDAGEAA